MVSQYFTVVSVVAASSSTDFGCCRNSLIDRTLLDTVQNMAFCIVKDGVLDGKRRHIAAQNAAFRKSLSFQPYFRMPALALILSATAGPLFSHTLPGPLAFFRYFSVGVQLLRTVMPDEPSSVYR